MADPTLGIISVVCICASGALLTKLCTMRNATVNNDSTEYLLIRKDHYNDLTKNASIMQQPILPVYSEKSPLQYYPPKDSAAFSNPIQ